MSDSAAGDRPQPERQQPADAIAQSSWQPTCTMKMLHVRAVMLRAVRAFFEQQAYLEVETPLLSEDVVVDAHLHPFEVPISGGQAAGSQSVRYLQTSPEAGMKRLLASGSGSIYQITRSFRRGEAGDRHNPEFTMIEWYGVGTDHHDQMRLTEQLVRQCLIAAAEMIDPPSTAAARLQEFGKITYEEAFQRALGESVIGRSVRELRALAAASGIALPDNMGTGSRVEAAGGNESAADSALRDDILNVLLATRIEPTLGTSRPEFVTGFPATQAALARLNQLDSRLADRFELYIDGIELCNGYYELTDVAELKRREQAGNQQRIRNASSELPGAPRMAAAMQAGLPACSGVALGFDRLVMVATGAGNMADVLPFPFDRA